MAFKVTDLIVTAPMRDEPGGCDAGASCGSACSMSITKGLMDLVDQHVLPQLRSALQEAVAKAEKPPQTVEEIEMLEARFTKALEELRAMKKAKAA